jgi:hypothetical protein
MRWRRALGIVAAQVGALLCVALAAEVGVRCWREKGIRAGFASLVDGRGTQIDPGTRGAFARDDELGYRLQPALEGVNRLGFRGPELPAKKPPGRFRILVVGDSIAWDADGFVTGLESRFRTEFHGDVEVFNASVPGYTTFQERVFLGRLLAPVAPDVVVLEYCLNDNHRFLHRLTEDGGWLLTPEARATLLPEGDGVAARVARWSYLAFEIRKRLLALERRSGSVHPWESEPDFGPAWREETWPAERAEILAIQAATRAADARLLVLAVPYEPQLEPSLLARERDLASRAAGAPRVDLHGRRDPVPRSRAGVRVRADGASERALVPRPRAPDGGRPRRRGTRAARSPVRGTAPAGRLRALRLRRCPRLRSAPSREPGRSSSAPAASSVDGWRARSRRRAPTSTSRCGTPSAARRSSSGGESAPRCTASISRARRRSRGSSGA